MFSEQIRFIPLFFGPLLVFFLFGKVSLSAKALQQNKRTITLSAVGDLIPHIPVKAAARQSINYHDMFSDLQDYLRGDLVFVNLETTIFPQHQPPANSVDWPMFFRESDDLLRALKKTGFNVLNIANNHIMDYGNEGWQQTVAILKKWNNFTVLGIRRHPRHLPGVTLVRNGIKIGLIGYTTNLNLRHRMPVEYPAVHYIQGLPDMEQMARDLSRLRSTHDLLIVSMHWGEEYSPEPDGLNQKLIHLFQETGVDVVLGHHPHVLQPVLSLPPSGKKKGGMLVIQSMGNFLSNQGQGFPNTTAPLRQGAIFQIQFHFLQKSEFPSKKQFELVGVQWQYLPLWTRNRYRSLDKESVVKRGFDRRDIQPVLLLCEIQQIQEQLRSSSALSWQERFYKQKELFFLTQSYQRVQEVLGRENLLPARCRP